VSRVLLFSVTSIGYQYRVNASSKHRVFTIFNLKYVLLCILIYSICAEKTEFGGTLLETSAKIQIFIPAHEKSQSNELSNFLCLQSSRCYRRINLSRMC
jgi:hypothetical protein